MIFNLKLLLITAVIAGAVFFTWHYKHTLEENKRLTAEILAANSTIEKLDLKFEAERRISETTDTIINEVRNAPETDDAPTAPVLDRAIDLLTDSILSD